MAPNISSIIPWQDQIGRMEGMVYALVLFSFAFFAMAGNLIVCFTIFRVKYLNMAAGHLILSLAIADIMTGACCMSIHATILAVRNLKIGKILCNIIGFVKISTICTSLSSLTVISVDRYLCIVYDVSYVRRFRRKWIAAAVIWVLASLFASFPIYGWGVYTLLPNKAICTVNWLRDISYTLALFTLYGFVTVTVMFIAYCGIALKVHHSRVKVRNSTIEGNTERQNPGISRDEIKVAKTMAIVIVSLVIAVTPYILAEMVSVGRNTTLHARTEIYITSILYANSCLNPLIYGGTNRRFRLAVKSLFGIKSNMPKPPLL